VRVLFISAGGPTQDYLRDCAFHGLRTLLGPDVVDVGRLDSMYLGADRSAMYGRGFTLYGLLPDLPIDRTDILPKIRCRHFDAVIYGSIHRDQSFLREVTSMYPPDRVAYLDGEDHPGYLRGLSGQYFKRELHTPQPGVLPIQFAIPAERILPSPPAKSRLMAPMDPLDASTYVYTDESTYFGQYASAYYAATMKKAGWDCLRHYEIMSQWCLPYFRSFEACPPTIAKFLPRAELDLIKHLVEFFYPPFAGTGETILRTAWEELIPSMNAVLLSHLTTEALAKYILDTISCN
jgi:hypothetical protein